MPHARLAVLAIALAAGGCSTGGLSTSSIFGGGTASTTQAAAPIVAPSDPTTRAFQVGSVSARAVKCGYNFDPAKLRASFLAAEAGGGLGSADVSRLEQIYDTAYNGVTKASAAESKYCTSDRTKEIKADLARHLAGDFSPTPPKKPEKEDEGLFSGWGSGSGSSEGMNVRHPMDNL